MPRPWSGARSPQRPISARCGSSRHSRLSLGSTLPIYPIARPLNPITAVDHFSRCLAGRLSWRSSLRVSTGVERARADFLSINTWRKTAASFTADAPPPRCAPVDTGSGFSRLGYPLRPASANQNSHGLTQPTTPVATSRSGGPGRPWTPGMRGHPSARAHQDALAQLALLGKVLRSSAGGSGAILPRCAVLCGA